MKRAYELANQAGLELAGQENEFSEFLLLMKADLAKEGLRACHSVKTTKSHPNSDVRAVFAANNIAILSCVARVRQWFSK